MTSQRNTTANYQTQTTATTTAQQSVATAFDMSRAQQVQRPTAGTTQPTNAPIIVNLLYMEDFDPEVDPEFIKKELKPYFSGVFADLSLRSTQSQSAPQRSIDKVTFVEYVNLPGIVSDRFHALASKNSADGRIYEENFIELMLEVFSSSVETKMRLTFKM